MKAKQKQVGTKAQIRVTKKRERRVATAIFLAVIILISCNLSLLHHTILNQPQNQAIDSASSQPKAAIVDQLSLTAPNQTFIETATNTLKQAGYTVDYYPGEKVNVELYRNLPTHRYSLIVLRVHSALPIGSSPAQGYLCLFTSETYSKTKYIHEQLTDQLVAAMFTNEETLYFGITHHFVLHSMKDKFQNPIIVMMGCKGLDNTLMAEAFVEKGAKVYISWIQPVSASHTDEATTQLLNHLLTEKQTIKQAVTETKKKVGADPTYKSQLAYYPIEAGDQTIDDQASLTSLLSIR